MSSSTHAGGIQPSSHFFHPSRPTHYSRPSSAESSHSFDEQDVVPRIKHSRDPLLPIGGRPTHPVRNSFDRMLGLSRGLSLDSIRRSTAFTPPQSGRSATFEPNKLPDEERGDVYPLSPYKPSHSHSDFLHSPHHHSPTPSSASPSPVPSFIPTPPPSLPPLSHTPLRHRKTMRFIRRYELHPSRNRFFLNGRLLTGGDSPWAFLASLTLVFGLAGVWFATTCVYWWKNQAVGGKVLVIIGAYLAMIVVSNMLATAMRDPGILPRGLDMDPPYPAGSPGDEDARIPMPRDLKVRSDIVRVKYCPTCKTYRPPRSSHCKMCDNCVDGCDHHCQWVNNCVGRRNYTPFIALLLSATVTLLLILVTSALHLYLITRLDNVNFRHALSQSQGIGSAVAFCLAVAVIWPVGALLSYHLRLLLLNVTTIEQIRNQAHKTLVAGPAPPNPFSHGSWRRNFVGILCRPEGYSWLDFSRVATEDRRGVNPGFGFVGGVSGGEEGEEGGEKGIVKRL